MKFLLSLYTAGVLALAMALAPASRAADLRTSVKDTPTETTTYVAAFDPSGLYVGGFVGWANIDRDVSRSGSRELGLDVTIPKDATQEDIDELAKMLSDAGIRSGGNQVPGGNLSLPIAGDFLSGQGSDDLSTAVFGADALYLRKLYNSSIAVSIGGGVTFYGGSETRTTYNGAVGSNALGTLLCPSVNTPEACGGDSFGGGQSGFVSVERDFDIDLIARLHWFASDRLAFNAGAGISFARANIKAGNFADADSLGGMINAQLPGLDTRINEDDWSVAPVFTVGADYWATDRIKLGLAYEYKNHEFDAKGSNSAAQTFDGGSIYAASHSRVKVEDDTHIVKFGASWKFN